MAKNKSKTIKISDSANTIIPCTMCNPKKYLKFNFSFITHESSSIKDQDILKFWGRMRDLSSEPFLDLLYKIGSDKDKWFEDIPIYELKKDIPTNFREIFPTETNEKFKSLRVYPSGTPKGTANPRIIGMIKNTVFYIFYLDWDGTLYKHNKNNKQR